LHIKGRGVEFYKGLITLAGLERYLSLDEFFERHQSATPSRDAESPGKPPTSISEVYERILDGWPLRLRRMERFLDPVSPPAALLRSMESTLQHRLASLSCYVAPPRGGGLGPHHDETEIFTLQISGTKRWQLFHHYVDDRPGIYEMEHLAPTTDDFVLEPGD